MITHQTIPSFWSKINASLPSLFLAYYFLHAATLTPLIIGLVLKDQGMKARPSSNSHSWFPRSHKCTDTVVLAPARVQVAGGQ